MLCRMLWTWHKKGEIMIKFFKKLWVEFWWGKPVELTPAEKRDLVRQNQQMQRAKINHKRKHKKGKRK